MKNKRKDQLGFIFQKTGELTQENWRINSLLIYCCILKHERIHVIYICVCVCVCIYIYVNVYTNNYIKWFIIYALYIYSVYLVIHPRFINANHSHLIRAVVLIVSIWTV